MLILLRSIDIFNLLEKLFIFIDFTNVEYLFNTYYDKDNGKKKKQVLSHFVTDNFVMAKMYIKRLRIF